MTTDMTFTAAELSKLLGIQAQDIVMNYWAKGKFPHSTRGDDNVVRIPFGDLPLDWQAKIKGASPMVETPKVEVAKAEIPVSDFSALRQEAEDYAKNVKDQADKYANDIRTEAEDYAEDIKAQANAYSELARKDADEYYEYKKTESNSLVETEKAKAAKVKEWADNYKSETVSRIEAVIIQRQDTLSGLESKIATKTKELENLNANMKRCIAKYKEILQAVEQNRSYHYNIAMKDYWGRFQAWMQTLMGAKQP